MPKKKYILKLTQDERCELASLARRGRCAGWKIQRAEALLAMDASESGPCWIDARVAEAYRCTSRAVEMWRKQAVEQGPMSLMERAPVPERVCKLGGEVEGRVPKLVEIGCLLPFSFYHLGRLGRDCVFFLDWVGQ